MKNKQQASKKKKDTKRPRVKAKKEQPEATQLSVEAKLDPSNPLADLPDHPSARPLRQAIVQEIGRSQGNRRLQMLIAAAEQDKTAGPQQQAGQLAQKEDTAEPGSDEGAEPKTRTDQAKAPVQRNLMELLGKSDRELIKLAGKHWSPGIAKIIKDYSKATKKERITLIWILIDQWWVGPSDESAIERIWSSFGDKLPEVAAEQPRLWKKCLDRGAELDDLKPIRHLRGKFRGDVIEKALYFLTQNKHVVHTEMGRLGVKGTSPPPEFIRERQGEALQEVQQAATEVARAKKALGDLKGIQIGWRKSPERVSKGHRDFRRTRYSGEVGFYFTGRDIFKPVHFDPRAKPGYELVENPQGPNDFPYWEQVAEQYDTVKATIAGYAHKHPAIFPLIRDEGIDKVTNEVNAGDALKVISQVLWKSDEKIDEAMGKIRSGDLDDRELKPIHDKLFSGQEKGVWGIPWNQPFYQWLAKDVVKDYEDRQWWTSLAIGFAAAAAMVAATMLTGGAAAVLFGAGLALGGVQAAMSWERYEDLATTADANIRADLALVYQGQADAALLTAVLDTVFVFLDAFGPVVSAARGGTPFVREAVQAGTKRAAIEGLETLGELGAREQIDLIRRATWELGVDETMRRTGKSADELLAIVGEESAAGVRITSFKLAQEAGQAGAKELTEKLGRLASLPLEEADKVVSQAIDTFGPQRAIQMAGGWKKLASTLGKTSAAGQRLMGYRRAVVADLKRYVRNELGGDLKVTGTLDKWTSDLDISLLGPNAAGNRDKALSFLAGRTGARTPDDLSKILYTDLFTDPRRMHLYDMLPGHVRGDLAKETAQFERELIWNRRLYQAKELGDDSLVIEIREQMSNLGVKEVRFKPLSAGDIAQVNKQVDALSKQLDEAVQAKDVAKQAELVKEIGQKQALVNAAEGGGYFSGGGVRKFVTERDKLPGFTPEELAAQPGRAMSPAQQLTAVLDQLPKLDEAADLLMRPAKAADVPAALKSIGKYGERITSLTDEALGSRIPGLEVFEEMAKTFDELLSAARSGTLQARMAAGETDALVQKAFKALWDMERASTTLLRDLGKRAQLEGITGASLARVQFATKAHAKLLRTMDATRREIAVLTRSTRTGMKATEGPAAAGEGETK